MSRKSLFLAGFAVVLAGLVLLFHFGPPGIKRGESRILSSMIMTNGSRLLLVAQRTGHLIDAYEVDLFRVENGTNVSVCWLGYEDGYWWGSSLQAEPAGDKVRIRAFWGTVGVYSVSDGSVTWLDKERKIVPSFKIDGAKVDYPIPHVVLTN